MRSEFKTSTLYALICIAIILALIASTSHVLAESSNSTSMKRVRTFSYTITDWGGWVLEVKVTTETPWIIGSDIAINISIKAMEAPENSTLSITKVSIITDTLEFSKYLGTFNSKGDNKTITFNIPLIDPEYAKLKPGEHTNKIINIGIEGYVKLGEQRIPYSSLLSMLVDVYVLPSYIKIDVDAPTEVELGDYIQLGITVKNTGAAPVYGVTLSVYDEKTFVDEKYINTLLPGGVAVVFVSFKPRKEGIHNIVIRVSWIHQSGVNGTTITTTKVIVKREINIYIYSNATEVNAFTAVELRGSTQPPLSNTTLDIEGSMDGGFTWVVLGHALTDATGNFKYIWVPSKPGNYVLRARFPGSEFYHEAVSNIVAINVLRGRPKLTISASPTTVEAGQKVKLSININPAYSVKLSIMYRYENQEWTKYTTVTTSKDGVTETIWIPLKGGTYYIKAVFEGNEQLASAESNIIKIKVIEPTTSTNTTSAKPGKEAPILSEEMVRYVVMGVIGGSAAISTYMWIRWRRR